MTRSTAWNSLALLALLPFTLGLQIKPVALSFTAAEVTIAFNHANPAVLGMDGAFSTPLPHDRALWVFGDTLIGHWKGTARALETMPSNTAAVVDDAAWSAGFPQAAFEGGVHPVQVLTSTYGPADRRVWPLDFARTPAGLALYYVTIAPTGQGGPMGFKTIGGGVAPETHPGSHRFAADPALWPAAAPSFGASVLAEGGWFYLYAAKDFKTYLARVRPASYRDRAAYQYWHGGDWVADWHQAAALPGSGPEVSVRFNPYLKRYLMTYLPPFGKQVVMRAAPAPEGPWSEPQAVIDCRPAGAMLYGAKQHEELSCENGRTIVISYNTNGEDATLKAHPEIYWPRLVRVRFR